MDVHIDEVATSIRAVDSQQLLSPRVLQRIVQEVLKAADERHAHRERVKSERRTSAGAADWESGEAC